MTKKKKTKSKKNSSQPSQKRLLVIFLLILLFAFLSACVSYIIMKNKDTNKTIVQKSEEPLKKDEEPKKKIDILKEFEPKNFENIIPKTKDVLFDKFEEYTEEFHNDFDDTKELDKKIDDIKKDIKKEQDKTTEDTKTIETKKPLEEDKKETKPKTTYNEKDYTAPKDSYVYDKKSKPKLVILIDDVSTQAQKDKILSMGYKINMAFLPPTKGHPDSARIAQNLPFHMIHFPMQASKAFKGEEPNTLDISDSYETIENRVKQLRAWYPNAKYTNNHTGSVFTENEESMDKLFKALKKYNFIFVDSRTSAKSVAKKYAIKYDMPYIVRNTFIDNERNFSYIQSQLKKAIETAKKNGYAIAIGHPHNETLAVLKASKHLLNDVEPIFMNELPYLK